MQALIQKNLGKERVQILLIVVVQFILLLFYCQKSVFNPGEYVFHNSADGLKNYYTLAAYVEDTTASESILHFKGFNYPFGETTFYTDNTPLLSVPLKLVNKHLFSTVGYTTYLFDMFSLLQILLSSVLCWLILRQLTDNAVLLVLFSITLPVLNPQLLRFVQGGTLNLSFSPVLLFPVYLMLRVYTNVVNQRKCTLTIIALAVFIYLSAFVHVYYLLILAILAGSFYLLVVAYLVIKKLPFVKFGVIALGTLLMAVVLFYLTLVLFDPYLSERNETALGYNIANWKLQVSSLFTAYHFLKTKYLISYAKYIPYEGHVYLGGFFLYSATAIVIAKIFCSKWQLQLSRHFLLSHKGIFLLFFTLSSLVLFFISVGPEYYFGLDNDYVFSNYYSLFYHIELNTKRITHFRCLGRFAWPVFWALNFSLIYLVAQLLKQRSVWLKVVLVVLLYFNCKDARNAYEFTRDSQNENPFELTTSGLSDVKQLADSVVPGYYQAIIPLPYYHVGTESHEYSIDPDQQHFVRTVTFANELRLPLMSSTMSRTSLLQADKLFSLINAPRTNDTLLSLLSEKPLLIYLDKRYYIDSTLYGNFDTQVQKNTFYNSRNITAKYAMTKIASVGELELYECSVNGLKGQND
jgi:hypothetical protein